jgi:hypothetical protein
MGSGKIYLPARSTNGQHIQTSQVYTYVMKKACGITSCVMAGMAGGIVYIRLCPYYANVTLTILYYTWPLAG